jgi:hypothetical protein
VTHKSYWSHARPRLITNLNLLLRSLLKLHGPHAFLLLIVPTVTLHPHLSCEQLALYRRKFGGMSERTRTLSQQLLESNQFNCLFKFAPLVRSWLVIELADGVEHAHKLDN